MDYHDRSYKTVVKAIQVLSTKFKNVCIPLRQCYHYDLIIVDSTPKTVKVIYTDCRAKSGTYVVNLRKSGGYAGKKELKESFDANCCDYVYIECPKGIYLIPSQGIKTSRSLSVSMHEHCLLAQW